jgi:hypothetical protein
MTTAETIFWNLTSPYSSAGLAWPKTSTPGHARRYAMIYDSQAEAVRNMVNHMTKTTSYINIRYKIQALQTAYQLASLSNYTPSSLRKPSSNAPRILSSAGSYSSSRGTWGRLSLYVQKRTAGKRLSSSAQGRGDAASGFVAEIYRTSLYPQATGAL